MEISHRDVVAAPSIENKQWVLRFFHKNSPLSQKYRAEWDWEHWFMALQKRNEYDKVQKIIFDKSLKGFRPWWTAGLFQNMASLETIHGLGYLNTSHSINMQGTFANCENLEELNLTGWDTHRVQDMCRMFAGCKKLQRLDLHSFDVSCVKDFRDMFQGCESLQEVLVNARYVDYWPVSWDFLRPSSA